VVVVVVVAVVATVVVVAPVVVGAVVVAAGAVEVVAVVVTGGAVLLCRPLFECDEAAARHAVAPEVASNPSTTTVVTPSDLRNGCVGESVFRDPRTLDRRLNQP